MTLRKSLWSRPREKKMLVTCTPGLARAPSTLTLFRAQMDSKYGNAPKPDIAFLMLGLTWVLNWWLRLAIVWAVQPSPDTHQTHWDRPVRPVPSHIKSHSLKQ